MDEDFTDAVQVYLDECRQFMGDGWQFWVERRFSLSALHPPVPMFGTSDFTAYHASTRKLVVRDYKHGVGVIKDAYRNPQLYYYALGCWLEMGDTPVASIDLGIVQPRAPTQTPLRTTVLDPFDLLEWSVDLIERAHLTQDPDAPMEAGDHCKFCPVSGQCVEQARAALQAAQTEFDTWSVDAEIGVAELVANPALLTPQTLGACLRYVDVLKGFAAALEERARVLLEYGTQVPGFALEQKRPTTKWRDAENEDALVGRILLATGLPESDVVISKVRTPAQIRGTLAGVLKGEGNARTKKDSEALAKGLLADLTITKSSGTKVVPVEKSQNVALARGDEFSEFLIEG